MPTLTHRLIDALTTPQTITELLTDPAIKCHRDVLCSADPAYVVRTALIALKNAGRIEMDLNGPTIQRNGGTVTEALYGLPVTAVVIMPEPVVVVEEPEPPPDRARGWSGGRPSVAGKYPPCPYCFAVETKKSTTYTTRGGMVRHYYTCKQCRKLFQSTVGFSRNVPLSLGAIP